MNNELNNNENINNNPVPSVPVNNGVPVMETPVPSAPVNNVAPVMETPVPSAPVNNVAPVMENPVPSAPVNNVAPVMETPVPSAPVNNVAPVMENPVPSAPVNNVEPVTETPVPSVPINNGESKENKLSSNKLIIVIIILVFVLLLIAGIFIIYNNGNKKDKAVEVLPDYVCTMNANTDEYEASATYNIFFNYNDKYQVYNYATEEVSYSKTITDEDYIKFLKKLNPLYGTGLTEENEDLSLPVELGATEKGMSTTVTRNGQNIKIGYYSAIGIGQTANNSDKKEYIDALENEGFSCKKGTKKIIISTKGHSNDNSNNSTTVNNNQNTTVNNENITSTPVNNIETTTNVSSSDSDDAFTLFGQKYYFGKTTYEECKKIDDYRPAYTNSTIDNTNIWTEETSETDKLEIVKDGTAEVKFKPYDDNNRVGASVKLFFVNKTGSTANISKLVLYKVIISTMYGVSIKDSMGIQSNPNYKFDFDDGINYTINEDYVKNNLKNWTSFEESDEYGNDYCWRTDDLFLEMRFTKNGYLDYITVQDFTVCNKS